MRALKTCPLDKNDITYTTFESETPFVVSPISLDISKKKSALLSYIHSHKEDMRDYLDKQGALLFRNFQLTDMDDFREVLGALDYQLMQKNLGGASPRPHVADKIFVSTRSPKPFIIGFHTEFVYQRTRPGMISFFCQDAPQQYGETPIFDCAKVFRSLEPDIRLKLETLGVRYYRRFYAKKSLLNFRKTWKEVFYSQSKSDVEQYLDSESMEYAWHDDGGLTTSIHLPAVIQDEHTNEKLLSLTMFNGESFAYNFWHFQERYHPLLRLFMEWMVHRESQPKNRFLYITYGDGCAFSRRESEAIQRAAWDNAIIYRWKKGDLLILNNKRWAHSRLNVVKKRNILCAMGDEYRLEGERYSHI